MCSTDVVIAWVTCQVDCKPHGHGDVHSLLYSTGRHADPCRDGLAS